MTVNRPDPDWVMVAPLVAHGERLGVLTVARDRRSLPFTTRDAQRLGVVADL